MFKMPDFVNLDDYDEVCRTCGDYGEFLSLFERNNENLTFADMIMECSSIKINFNDGFPEKICFLCVTQVKQAYAFKRRCEELDQIFHLNGIQSIDVKPDIEYDVKDEVLEQLNPDPVMLDDLDIEIPSIPEIDVVKEELLSPKDSRTAPVVIKIKKRKVKLINCRICNKVISSHTERQHMKTHSSERPYKCNVCKKEFSYAYNLKRHMMAHNNDRPHMCNICGKRFIQYGTFEAHYRIHTGERPFSCTECGKTFRQVKHVTLHMKTHNNAPKEADPLRRRRGPNKMKRDASKQSERTAENYPFQCNLCSKRFSSNPALKHHITYHGEKKFLCSYCGKAFINKTILDTHSTVHTGIKKYSCTICCKSFAYSSYLKTHMYVHTGEKPFECNVCHRRFAQLPHMKAHLRIHAGIKPYGCDICGKHFSLTGNLRVHRRIHTGETPFLCPVCNKGFYDSSSMKKHWRTHGDKTMLKEEPSFL